jgi:hypothetical protein
MLRRFIAILSGLLTTGGCDLLSQDDLPADQPGSFTLIELNSKEVDDGTLKTWIATSRANGNKPFKFRLELLFKATQGNSRFAFSKGAIIREKDADGQQFLAEVARAIESEVAAPMTSELVDRLEFSTAILGTSLSRGTSGNTVAGGFTSSKPGNWSALKLFLADGEGEVFLNINPIAGIGEFSTKDPDYGEVVLRELATVFLEK